VVDDAHAPLQEGGTLDARAGTAPHPAERTVGLAVERWRWGRSPDRDKRAVVMPCWLWPLVRVASAAAATRRAARARGRRRKAFAWSWLIWKFFNTSNYARALQRERIKSSIRHNYSHVVLFWPLICRSAREGISILESNIFFEGMESNILSISSAISNFLIFLRPNSSRVEFGLSVEFDLSEEI
jgi:hypothetical protein